MWSDDHLDGGGEALHIYVLEKFMQRTRDQRGPDGGPDGEPDKGLV